jgi:hypothetical protein
VASFSLPPPDPELVRYREEPVGWGLVIALAVIAVALSGFIK